MLNCYYAKGLDAFVKVGELLYWPLNLINLFFPLIGIIWLFVLGEWKLVIYSLLSFFIVSPAFYIVIITNALFISPESSLFRKEKYIFYFFGFLSSIYSFFVVSLWCTIVLNYFYFRSNHESIVPFLFLSYLVAIAPVEWVSKNGLIKKNRSEFISIPLFFVKIGYVLAIFSIIIFRISLSGPIFIFLSIMFIGFIILFFLSLTLEREKCYKNNNQKLRKK